MTIENLLEILENNVAPVALSDEFCAKCGAYDNSGIIINCNDDVKGVLFSLDLTVEAVNEAKKRGFNAIVTHHPAIYGGISRLDTAGDAQSLALCECIRGGISVISMHLNFDAAPEGIDYHLMRALGGEKAAICDKFTQGGYGRAYDIPEVGFAQYVRRVEEKFGTERSVSYGDGGKAIKKVASFCGAGCDDGAIAFAKAQGADVVVSSDIPHHRILNLVENGINVIALTHYCAETYGFNKIYEKISKILSLPSSFFADERYM